MGHHMLIHTRSKDKGVRALQMIYRESRNEDLELVLADYASLREVMRIAEEIKREQSRLDVLINNAGNFYKEREISSDGLEMTLAVNHLAPFQLTMELLDLMKSSAPSRIVTVASGAHRNLSEIDFNNLQWEKNYNGYDAFALSKLGNILFTNALARRLQGTVVTANGLHPGVIDTKLLHKSNDIQGADVVEGAQASVYLAVSPEVEGISGKYFSRMQEKPASDLATDKALQEKF